MGDEDRTLWVGNLSENVDEDLLYELFLQAGPLQTVTVKKPANGQNPFGFVTYQHEESVAYAIVLFEGTTLFGRVLNMRERSANPDGKYKRLMADYLRDRERSHREDRRVSHPPRDFDRPRYHDSPRPDNFSRQPYDFDARQDRDYRGQDRYDDRKRHKRFRN
ncbi:uncharacterized RNA-binding protein C25G10.01 [Galendromus occidentalis]|uniref:Uncharacterized RNA-binding protein C25G10.01 n=1 Tax=Galendromus occidentalis TaxID=34638 RepID=A0AAJ6QY72_9ACAR|nr:uncharacterized RNA-binding protein C25G10.01 [Galendromus occidentalis]